MAAIPADQVGDVNSQMNEILLVLRDAIADLDSKSSSINAAASSVGWALLGPIGLAISAATAPTDDARSAIQSALATMRNVVNRLDTSSRDAVMSGNETIQQWAAAADTVREGLSGLAQQLGLESTWAVHFDTLRMRTESLVKEVAPYAKLGLGLGVAVLALGGLFLISHYLGGSSTVIIRDSRG